MGEWLSQFAPAPPPPWLSTTLSPAYRTRRETRTTAGDSIRGHGMPPPLPRCRTPTASAPASAPGPPSQAAEASQYTEQFLQQLQTTVAKQSALMSERRTQFTADVQTASQRAVDQYRRFAKRSRDSLCLTIWINNQQVFVRPDARSDSARCNRLRVVLSVWPTGWGGGGGPKKVCVLKKGLSFLALKI